MSVFDQLVDTPGAPGAKPTADGSVRYVLGMAQLLANLGESSSRVEAAIDSVSKAIELPTSAVVLPSGVFATFTVDGRRWTQVLRVHPQSPRSDLLVAIDRLSRRVTRRELTPDEAFWRLEQLQKVSRPTTTPLAMLASAMLALSSSLLLGASFEELLIATALGTVVSMSWRAASDTRLNHLAPVLLGALASSVAFAAAPVSLLPIRPLPVLIAALLPLLPGGQLTTAMRELATGHLVSGSGRLLAAITRLLLLVVGAALGQQVTARFGAGPVFIPMPVSVPWLVRVIGPALAGLALAMLSSARRKDAPWVVLGCVAASIGSVLGGLLLGSLLSAFAGAFIASLVSHYVGRMRRLPTSVIQDPATLMLVPGSVGFLSLGSFLQQNVEQAVLTGFQMFFVAITLSLGAMAAELAVIRTRQ